MGDRRIRNVEETVVTRDEIVVQIPFEFVMPGAG
jgi:hypothetical protein